MGATDRPSLRGLPVHGLKAQTDTGKPEDGLIRDTLIRGTRIRGTRIRGTLSWMIK